MSEKYNTNLAAEFHVLSVLHRLGADASLSLGNKKAVDITVVRGDGMAVTIDVKGVAGKFDWPADNVVVRNLHFIALVSFQGRIRAFDQMPWAWIVPSVELGDFLSVYAKKSVHGERRVVSRAKLNKTGGRFRDAWPLLTESQVRG